MRFLRTFRELPPDGIPAQATTLPPLAPIPARPFVDRHLQPTSATSTTRGWVDLNT